MPDKLPHDEDRHLDVVGDGALLEWARVAVFVQIDQQLLVLLLALAGAFVGDAGRLHDAKIRSQMVDVTHVALAENGNGVAGLHQVHQPTAWPQFCPVEKGRGLIKL